ncbi:MAG: agmatine deiminase family protein [Hyphomicrobiales bacterium]
MMLAAAGASAGASRAAGGARAEAPDYARAGADIQLSAPADDGFYFPAEWQPHERTLMQFLPPQNWAGRDLSKPRAEWANVANAVADFEPVTMAVRPQDAAAASRLLSSSIDLVEMPMNDGWCRDSGPMILVNGGPERRVAGFEFNSWGGKYRPYDDDALVKARLAGHFGMPFHPADLVLEGGAVHVDGEGTLITTEQCLRNANRNPGRSKGEIEAVLKGWLGVEKIIWLAAGLAPDTITDGHVDGVAAFAAPGVVLLHMTDDRGDPNHAITSDARAVLEGSVDAKGRTLDIIPVPLGAGDVVHMNFYICNGGVVVPVTGNACEDDAPLAILRDAFPGREIVPVAGRFIAEGGGGVHCITQQMPAV